MAISDVGVGVTQKLYSKKMFTQELIRCLINISALNSDDLLETGSEATADFADVLGGHRGPCLVDSMLHGAHITISDARGIGRDLPLDGKVQRVQVWLWGGHRFLSQNLRLALSHSWATLEV